MRYVAMSLKVALSEKFPEVSESEILKVKNLEISCLWFFLKQSDQSPVES